MRLNRVVRSCGGSLGLACCARLAVADLPTFKVPVARDLSQYRQQFPTHLTRHGPPPAVWQDDRPLVIPRGQTDHLRLGVTRHWLNSSAVIRWTFRVSPSNLCAALAGLSLPAKQTRPTRPAYLGYWKSPRSRRSSSRRAKSR